MYKFSNNTKYIVHKSILLRTFRLYKKSIIFIVRLSYKFNYERSLKNEHFFERFGREIRIYI
ncbi:hypothetical protein CCZ20_27605 [Priestia aryabhattai]|nr:hypothetical protein CCZ20_27605 [Priestia aryabhattai]